MGHYGSLLAINGVGRSDDLGHLGVITPDDPKSLDPQGLNP